MFKSIESISTLFTSLGSIFALLIILLNIFWKSYCSKKYGISKKYFFLQNIYSILFYVLAILLFIPLATYSIIQFSNSISISKKVIDLSDFINLIYVILYLIVLSGSVFVYMQLNLYKKLDITEIKLDAFIYFSINTILFSVGLVVMFNIRNSISNIMHIFVLIITSLSLFFTIYNIKKEKIEPITYLCIFLLNLGLLYYSIYFLNFIILVVTDKPIICLKDSQFALNLLSTIIGLAINIVSIAYLIMRVSIEKEYDKQLLISQINYSYNRNLPNQLAVICEYKDKFLAVSYKEDKDETIILNTKKYWLVNQENYTIREKFYKNKVIKKDKTAEDKENSQSQNKA